MKRVSIVNFVIADCKNRKLFVPSHVMKKTCLLTDPAAQLFMEYRNRYPDYALVVF